MNQYERKYRKMKEKYELLQFLYFNKIYNGFNVLPKLLLFMDKINKRNNVSIDNVKLEYIYTHTNEIISSG